LDYFGPEFKGVIENLDNTLHGLVVFILCVALFVVSSVHSGYMLRHEVSLVQEGSRLERVDACRMIVY
jgi:hypothetical protein